MHVQSVKNCCFSLLNMQIYFGRRRNGWLSSLITNCGIHVTNVLAPRVEYHEAYDSRLAVDSMLLTVSGRYQYFSSRIV